MRQNACLVFNPSKVSGYDYEGPDLNLSFEGSFALAASVFVSSPNTEI